MVHSKLWIVAAFAAAASLLPAQDKGAKTGSPVSPVPSAQSANPQSANPQSASGQPVEATARAKNAPIIGVVDLDKAIDLYPKAIAERERLQNLFKEFAERLKSLDNQIDQLKAEMTTLKEGSDRRDDLVYQLSQAFKNRDGYGNHLKSKRDREVAKFELMIYQDVDAAVTEVAKASGVDIVLRIRATPSFEDVTKEGSDAQMQRLAAYDRQLVWFAKDEVDLTQALIKVLRMPADAKSGGAAPKDAAGNAPAGAGDKKDGAKKDDGKKGGGL